jgi:hypothetical protein
VLSQKIFHLPFGGIKVLTRALSSSRSLLSENHFVFFQNPFFRQKLFIFCKTTVLEYSRIYSSTYTRELEYSEYGEVHLRFAKFSSIECPLEALGKFLFLRQALRDSHFHHFCGVETLGGLTPPGLRSKLSHRSCKQLHARQTQHEELCCRTRSRFVRTHCGERFKP